MPEEQSITITMADVVQLCRDEPHVKALLENVALRRLLAEARANGRKEELPA